MASSKKSSAKKAAHTFLSADYTAYGLLAIKGTKRCTGKKAYCPTSDGNCKAIPSGSKAG